MYLDHGKIVVAVLLTFCLAGDAHGEVMDAESNGFTVRHEVTIAASRAAVYEATVSRIGEWWSSDHTVSGNAANLYFVTSVPGCFCERLGDGAALVHMTLSFINPGVMFRLTGGLGPLGLMGVAGNMTWEFEDVEDGTLVTLVYAVGGYMPGGLDSVAAPVDEVVGEALKRLKAFVETGSPG